MLDSYMGMRGLHYQIVLGTTIALVIQSSEKAGNKLASI